MGSAVSGVVKLFFFVFVRIPLTLLKVLFLAVGGIFLLRRRRKMKHLEEREEQLEERVRSMEAQQAADDAEPAPPAGDATPTA